MIDPSVLTREAALEAMRAVVAQEGPETVYVPPSGITGDCVYYCRGNDGLEPSCLWGHILIRLGMDYEELEKYPHHNINELLSAVGVTDYGFRVAAHWSQMYQDTGETWQYCLEQFEDQLKRYS